MRRKVDIGFGVGDISGHRAIVHVYDFDVLEPVNIFDEGQHGRLRPFKHMHFNTIKPIKNNIARNKQVIA